MKYLNKVVPLAVDLTQESTWQKVPHINYAYFIARFHFILFQRQIDAPVQTGEKIAAYFVPDEGVESIETLKSIEFEHTWFLAEETVETSLIEEQSLYEFTNHLAMGVEVGTGKLSNEVRFKAEDSFRKSITDSYKVQKAETKRETTKFEVKQKFRPGHKENIVAVATYQRYAFDIYLHYYDYLFVEYKKSIFGLRKKRRNLPRPEGNKHMNRVKLNWPICSLCYWKLLPESARLISESDYVNEVKNPFKIEINKLDSEINLPLPKKLKKPTLYQISVATFPLKWIHRSDERWTEEDLKQIEFKEAEGTAWWWQYGPGRQ